MTGTKGRRADAGVHPREVGRKEEGRREREDVGKVAAPRDAGSREDDVSTWIPQIDRNFADLGWRF